MWNLHFDDLMRTNMDIFCWILSFQASNLGCCTHTESQNNHWHKIIQHLSFWIECLGFKTILCLVVSFWTDPPWRHLPIVVEKTVLHTWWSRLTVPVQLSWRPQSSDVKQRRDGSQRFWDMAHHKLGIYGIWLYIYIYYLYIIYIYICLYDVICNLFTPLHILRILFVYIWNIIYVHIHCQMLLPIVDISRISTVETSIVQCQPVNQA